LGGKKENL